MAQQNTVLQEQNQVLNNLVPDKMSLNGENDVKIHVV